MVPRPLERSGVEAQGAAGGEQKLTRTQGGVSQKQQGGVSHPHLPFVAVVVRLFVLRPADPNRASGEGRDGSDPPFCAAGAARRRGWCQPRCQAPCQPPLAFGEVAPVCMYPCRKAPRPARGPDDKQRRAARCVTDASARSWSSAASVSRPPGRGPARFPRPIPWRCSSAPTPRTCIAPSSRGTTSRPAWPCSWPGNSSSVRRGSGSPEWASVWGSGPAFRRGRFRLRRTGRPSSSARSITRSEPSRARLPNGCRSRSGASLPAWRFSARSGPAKRRRVCTRSRANSSTGKRTIPSGAPPRSLK